LPVRVIKSKSSSLRFYPIRWIVPFLALLLGLGLTSYVTNHAIIDAEKANMDKLAIRGKEVIFSVNSELGRYGVLLSSADAFMKASDNITRENFRSYFNAIKHNTDAPKNLSLSYNPIVHFPDLYAHEESIRAEGLKDYYVSPLGQRRFYTPVRFIEPFESNKYALGYDTYSETDRRMAMDLSLAMQQPVVSKKILLVQSDPLEPEKAVIMFYPHHRFDNEVPLSAKNGELLGWLAIVISLDRLFGNTLLSETDLLFTDIFVGSHENENSLVYSNVPKTNTPQLTNLMSTTETVGNRDWTFKFSTPTNTLLSNSERNKILVVDITVGLILSMLIALYLFQVLTTRSSAYILNHKITKDLAKSELRFKTMFEHAPIGIAKVNSHTGVIEDANQMYAVLVGVPFEQVKGTNWKAITHPDDIQRDTATLKRLVNEEIDQFKVEKRYVHKDGKTIWVRLVVAALPGRERNQKFHLSMIDDITQAKHEEAELFNAIRIKDLALNSAKAIHFEWEIATNRLNVNKNSASTFDRQLESDFGERHEFLELIHPDDKKRVIKTFSHQVSKGSAVDLSFRIFNIDGSIRHILMRGELSYGVNAKPEFVNGLLLDVTRERATEIALKDSEEQLRLSTELANVATWEVDLVTRTLKRSKNYDSLYGLPYQESWNFESFTKAIHPEDRERCGHLIRSSMEPGGEDKYQIDFRVIFPDESIKWLTVIGLVSHRSNTGAALQIRGCLIDITLRKEADELNKTLALYDQLTGLPNRVLMNDHFDLAISACKRHGRKLTVMFLDLDHFKDINDSMGHSVGDQLLINTAKTLIDCLRDEDTVARLGGDEFMVILPDSSIDGAAQVAENILIAVSNMTEISGYQVSTSVSIGIAQYPNDGEGIEVLSKNADIALYRAKGSGRNTFRFFTPEMQEHSTRHLFIANALRTAIDNDQLMIHYQPQFSGNIIGVEALLRWEHPEMGPISPAEFIPIAEANGTIMPIGEWVLKTAATQLKLWRDAGYAINRVAVNFSAKQFQQNNVIENVVSIVDSIGISRNCIELELTEAVGVDRPIRAIEIMEALTESGFQLAIDDFGTGFSSMNYLKKFKVHTLKIDQSFIRDITNSPSDQAIVIAIINMANSLDMMTIAEGVETKEQWDFLKAQGCTQFQGYYFSRPLTPKDCELFFEKHDLLRPMST
jgi:diguanylate cyclase (GGDEF)-like protein/PAS domain S-box-containing protein